MDPRTELRNFLSTRRARIPPQAAGLAVAGGHRRVPGLRREEVAMLAGVSVEYYTRLERGRASGVSDSVLDSIGSVLQLDDVEQSHLRRLIRGASADAAVQGRPAPQELRPSLHYLLDAIEGAPAFIRDGRLNLLGANELGRSLYSPHYRAHAEAAGPTEEGGVQAAGANIARFVFLDEGARTFYTDWEKVAGDTSSSSSSASADGITMTIEGKTTNFSALDVYKNTLSKAQLSYEVEEEDTSSDSESSANSDGTYSKETSSDSDSSDSDSQSKKKKKSATKKKAMKENLVTAVNVKDSSLSAGGSQNEALVSFTLTVTFNDSAFSPKSTNIKLEVPKETTSDGDRNAPKETFHTDAKDKSNDKKDEQ